METEFDRRALVDQAAGRAGMLWQRRKKILAAASLAATKQFNTLLRQSVLQRNEQMPAAAEDARRHLSDHGFKVLSFSDGAQMAHTLKGMIQQGVWLRSSSRPVNYLLALLHKDDTLQTDIYERYISGQGHGKKAYYPRNQTLPEDYSGTSLQTDARTGRNPRNGRYGSPSRNGNHNALIGSNHVTQHGEIMIIENTGNISHLLAADRTILFTGDDKLVLSLDMALLWQKILIQYGLRSNWGAHTHILSAPHFTDTLPGFRPPYGGGDVTVAWIKGKMLASGAAGGSGGTSRSGGTACIECGLCMEFCPAVELYGAAFSWHGYTGGIGILKAFLWEGATGAMEAHAWMCSDCGKCSKACPIEFDIFEKIRQVKTALRSEPAYRLQEEHNQLLMSDYLTHTADERIDG